MLEYKTNPNLSLKTRLKSFEKGTLLRYACICSQGKGSHS